MRRPIGGENGLEERGVAMEIFRRPEVQAHEGPGRVVNRAEQDGVGAAGPRLRVSPPTRQRTRGGPAFALSFQSCAPIWPRARLRLIATLHDPTVMRIVNISP